jgi:lysophospholipase L1-like esterase
MQIAASSRHWAADDPLVSYEGRYALGASRGVRMGFPGIITRLRTDAASVRAAIEASSDDVYFGVSVDSGEPLRIRLKKGANEMVLLEGASAAKHSIEMVRLGQSWEGVCSVTGFTTVGGILLEPPALPGRRLLFIGDSITCGEGTEPSDIVGKAGPERSNASATYAAQLARRLDAQCHLVSYGGRGIIRDWQGIRATNNAPQFYELALPDDPTAPWDPRRYVPDAVGICLGTNDFSQGIPDQNEFVNAYVEFVRKVMRDAPGAPVILIDSPILTDDCVPRKSVCRSYVDETVGKVGSPQVTRAWVRHYDGSPGDGHPVAAEHVLMADELEPAFRRALGID